MRLRMSTCTMVVVGNARTAAEAVGKRWGHSRSRLQMRCRPFGRLYLVYTKHSRAHVTLKQLLVMRSLLMRLIRRAAWDTVLEHIVRQIEWQTKLAYKYDSTKISLVSRSLRLFSAVKCRPRGQPPPLCRMNAERSGGQK